MGPITPLGKPLTQQPIASADIPVTPAIAPQVEEPVTAFQWVSLARASWNWIVRPLWYICVKWPLQLMLIPSTKSTSRDDEDSEWMERHLREQGEKMAERMKI
ncbi:hypothetical protein N7373_05425 [Achromobacter mucicolens]|uniref:hypothetical protein n=1 Tax=Achromobacter mucicolens TaxID=1389922 RepID=UPI00244AAFBC|nr:hypothetical protein [Achromobacter mucicolens]MDH0090881.1 hypothetical protein [Achromobacter mucicolens]